MALVAQLFGDDDLADQVRIKFRGQLAVPGFLKPDRFMETVRFFYEEVGADSELHREFKCYVARAASEYDTMEELETGLVVFMGENKEFMRDKELVRLLVKKQAMLLEDGDGGEDEDAESAG